MEGEGEEIFSLFMIFLVGEREEEVCIEMEETCSSRPETARKSTEPMGLGETTGSPLEPNPTSPGGVELCVEEDIRTEAKKRGRGSVGFLSADSVDGGSREREVAADPCCSLHGRITSGIRSV